MTDFELYSTIVTDLESFLNSVKKFCNNINVELGLEKCTTLAIHRGKNKANIGH